MPAPARMRPSRFRPALALALLIAAPGVAAAGAFEDAVLDEINFARTQPQAYARQAMRLPSAYEGPGSFMDPRDQERGALEEAIEFLMAQTPLPPLQAHP